MPLNRLYLAVLPLIHTSTVGPIGFGLTEQTLTLFPDRNLATEFYPDEADSYLITFKNRADKYLTGGHVTHYDVSTEPTDDGRVIVVVIQHVRE
jgi:hypothetical protein